MWEIITGAKGTFQKHKSDHAASLLTNLHGFSGHSEENLEFLPLPSDALNDLASDFCFNTVSFPLLTMLIMTCQSQQHLLFSAMPTLVFL